jgi:hypothetical protein
VGNVLKLKRSWTSQQKAWSTELFEKNNTIEILRFNATNFFLDLKAVNKPIEIKGAKFGNVWMSVKSAAVEDLIVLLSRYNKKKFPNTSNNVRYWIRRTLLARYSYRFNVYEESNYLLTKRARPGIDPSLEEEREFDDLVGGDRVQELTDQLVERSNLFGLEEEEQEELLEQIGARGDTEVVMFGIDPDADEDVWEAVAQENTETKTYLKEITIDKMHPFWDELIDTYRTIDQYNLHRILASGTRFSQGDIAVGGISDLYDIFDVQERPEDTLSVSGIQVEVKDYDEVENEFENY